MAGILLEEYELLGDVRYRSYVSAVDKALKSFEYTSEWADLISALAKLNKVLLSHCKFQVIPRRITISKRLAQCMHPALPSGVHLKALETYDIIFKCIGSTRLSQELFIYSAGLFPLLANAAMNVKPALLTIYETHFIPLEEKLRPGLNGFLIGVLPGLDEGSDYYERADNLLQKICDGVEKSFFYGCMWKCVLSNPVIRLPAITFITSHFSKKRSTEDQLHIMGTDIDSMVHGLCSSLQDISVLVQRCALDLLLLGFPIHNNQLVAADMVHIVTAAVTVVLRRDMSLNRRLFSWLLGGDTVNPAETIPEVTESSKEHSYFNLYSRDLLLEALNICIHNTASAIPAGNAAHGSPDILCYRLLISLFDRPEISATILDDILIEVFRSLYSKCQNQQSLASIRTELIKTANLFFATLEPWYLWAYAAKLFKNACERENRVKQASKDGEGDELAVCKGQPTITEMCNLLSFLLDVVSLETYLEARSEHLPELMCQIADALIQHCEGLTCADLSQTLLLCSKILSKVQTPVINVDDLGKTKKASYGAKTVGHEHAVQTLVNGTSPDLLESYHLDGHMSLNHGEHLEDTTSQTCPLNLSTSITNCMINYEKLLVSFLKHKVVSDFEKTLQNFESLLLPKACGQRQREAKLEDILHTSLRAQCKFFTADDVEIFNRNIRISDKECELVELKEIIPKSKDLNQSFTRLCQIIIELSSFPVYCTNSRTLSPNNFNEIDSILLPEWLKLLVSLACFGDWEEIAFTAISTIFDLVSLTQSMGANCQHPMSQPSNKYDYNLQSVVSIPIMTASQLLFLLEETMLYKTVIKKLWRYVGHAEQHLCLKSAELIQKVHNLSFSSLECEAVICRSMSSGKEMEQLHAQRKFCILWHLTRDSGIKLTPLASVKAFDQCFFQLLDNLAKETGPQKSIAQSWLNHSLQRGDIARFMEPVLMILLHPDSARVSIQHVSVHSPKKFTVAEEGKGQNSEEFETKIYAISSISGNVIYHVSDESHPSSQHVSPQKKISTLTSILNVNCSKISDVITHKSTLCNWQSSLQCEKDFHLPMSVFVNPFGSLSSLCSDSQLDSVPNTPDLTELNRIKKKYSFEQEDEEEEEVLQSNELVSSIEGKVEEIVASLMEEVIEAVAKSIDENTEDLSYSIKACTENNQSFESLYNKKKTDASSNEESKSNHNSHDITIHPIHSYILLYCQVYDSKKTVYALYCLKSIILTNPRLTLCSMATTNISNSLSFRGQQLQFLLARHRKSVFSNDFHGELSAEGTTMYRSSTFLETVILTCLYHIRSYYPNLPQMRLTNEEVLGNREVRLLCMEVLTVMFSELISILKDSGKNFASYLNDLLIRSKVQKTLLHCLVACVYDSQSCSDASKKYTFTEAIVEFNDKGAHCTENSQDNYFQDTLQMHLLQLVATLIALEDTISSEKDSRSSVLSKNIEFSFDRTSHLHNQSHMAASKYQPGSPIPAQSMFLNAVLTALDHQHNRHLHIHWLSLVVSALPFAGRWLARLVMTVIIQLCFNLEVVATNHLDKSMREKSDQSSIDFKEMPPDYLIIVIESLTTLCHYCLLECPPITNLFNPSVLQQLPSQSYGLGTSPSQIISNLIHVFSVSIEKDSSAASEPSATIDPVLSARRSLLSNLPCIISSLTAIYRAASSEKSASTESCWVVGSPKLVKQHILSFLSPISLNYGSNFIAALAVIWHEQRNKNFSQIRKVIPEWSAEQLLLVDLLAAIKVLPIESIVQTVRNVLKQPPTISQKHSVPLEVSTLQLFLAYIQQTSASCLVESWQSLLSLWRDGLQLSSPPVNFHLLAILHEFVQRASILEEKKSQKDLQDITHKLIEACSTVASASLEQTTWLWRNLAVRPIPQTDVLGLDLPDNNQEEADVPNSVPISNSEDNAQYSVQALMILAEFLAPVLDYVYIGEEKDKVIPLLSNIMYYVTPYLKNHSSHNAPSFRSCCQLLSSISSYQHTRKAWRKDAFDLLLDPAFFQMSSHCLVYWKAIIDHLMTHDKTTFRDFMGRVSVAQSGSLNLFSSKEQEYEQRAHLLKRLAFVLFCSELDQYQKYMPDIQERLTECLRLHQVPSVHAEVFLCFRVLLIRMSAHHVTSLWPVIITEMVQIFTQMECELCTDSDEFSCGVGLKKLASSHLRRLSTLDSAWVTNTMNGLNAHNNPAWLHLYLSVCKLLDMAVALPANVLPQFQMYRWAFVGDSPPDVIENHKVDEKPKLQMQEFVPHVTRLAKLLSKKVDGQNNLSALPGQLLITKSKIHNIQDIHNFFIALANIPAKKAFHCDCLPLENAHPTEERKTHLPKCQSAPELLSLASLQIQHLPKAKSTFEQIEMVLENDFIETFIE